MSDLLEVRGLTVELPTAARWVRPVNEVSLRIAAGESLGLVGESGGGKTMVSLALMGLLPPGARVNGEASFAALPPGCAFEPRCELRREECTAAVPALRVIDPAHAARYILV